MTTDETALKGAFQESGDVRPIDDLQQQGIQSVRVLSQSQLGEVLRVAVNRAVRRQLGDLDLPVPVLERLRDATEMEYARLLAEGLEHPAPGPGAAPPPDSSPRLLSQAPQRSPMPPAQPPAPAAPVAESATQPGQTQDLDGMEQRMAQNISQLLQKDWRTDLAQVQESQQSQLQLLEQRIAKLVGALESTDRLVTKIQKTRPATDTAHAVGGDGGGPDENSPLFERKSELLSALFQANMELRELQGRSDSES